MAGPWEEYQTSEPKTEGPWANYAPKPPERSVASFGVASPSGTLALGQEAVVAQERLRQTRNSEINAVLGDAFDPETTFIGGVEGFFRQMDITRSGALQDKQRKFRETFPEGALILVQTSQGPILLARPDPSSSFQEISRSAQMAGGLVSEPTILGTAGAFAAGPAGPALTALGVGAGIVAQSKIEQARGYGTAEGGLGRAFAEGGVAGATDVMLRGLGRIFMGARRFGLERLVIKEGLDAANELGLEPLAVGQVGGPFVRGLFRQVAVTAERVERKISAEGESLLNSFRAMSEQTAATSSDDVLLNVMKAQQGELSDLITLPGLLRTDAGTALQKGIETYRKASKRLIGRLYAKAMALSDDVIFNLRPTQSVANDVRRGVLGRGEEVTRAEISPIVDEFGRPITREITETRAVSLAETPAGRLEEVVDDILALDPNVAKFAAKGGEFTSFEQIKTLRTRLFDLKQSDDGMIRREAKRLWASLTGVMDNPISGNPDFVAAYRKASGVNRIVEDTLDLSFIGRLIRSDTPEALAAKYFRPGHATELNTIREIVPAPRWKEFKTSFAADVANSPTAREGLSRIERFKATDPDGLRLLLSPMEESELSSFLTRKAQFEASPVREIIAKQMTDGEKFVAMAKTGTAGELADAIRLSGGPGSDYALNAKAGVYLSIMNEARDTTVRGVDVINANKLLSAIERWKKSGKIDVLFDENDWRRLSQFQKYAAPISETADIGGGMMAGSIRQEAARATIDTLTGETKRVIRKLVRPLLQNEMMAWVLSRPSTYHAIGGAEGGRLPLREIGLSLMIADREAALETEQK